MADVLAAEVAAEVAAEACRAAAAVLRDVTEERHRVVQLARERWSGPHRDRFDAGYGALLAEAAAIEPDLRRAAGALRTTAERGGGW